MLKETQFRVTENPCELCGNYVKYRETTECDHPKNGYCAKFRAQAAIDINQVHETVKSFKKEI